MDLVESRVENNILGLIWKVLMWFLNCQHLEWLSFSVAEISVCKVSEILQFLCTDYCQPHDNKWKQRKHYSHWETEQFLMLMSQRSHFYLSSGPHNVKFNPWSKRYSPQTLIFNTKSASKLYGVFLPKLLQDWHSKTLS